MDPDGGRKPDTALRSRFRGRVPSLTTGGCLPSAVRINGACRRTLRTFECRSHAPKDWDLHVLASVIFVGDFRWIRIISRPEDRTEEWTSGLGDEARIDLAISM